MIGVALLLLLTLTGCWPTTPAQSVEETRRMRDNLRCLNIVPPEPLEVCMERKGWRP